MGHIVVFNYLAAIPNVALLMLPMVPETFLVLLIKRLSKYQVAVSLKFIIIHPSPHTVISWQNYTHLIKS